MKQLINIRLSHQAIELLELLKKREGLSRTGVLEVLVREGARARGMALITQEENNESH